MKTSALFAALVALALLPARADAQQLKLQIDNGRVTLDAQNVPARQILAEWARIGGAKIVNGEKIVGAPLTLQLQGTPERQALDIILRGVSGYMLAARQEGTGVSAFDRILILPTSTAPRASAAPQPTPGFGGPAMNRRVPVQAPEPVADEDIVEDDDNDEPEPGDGEEEVVEQQEPPPPGPVTQPDLSRFPRRPNVLPNPLGGQAAPFVPPTNLQTFPAQPANVPPQPQGMQPTPMNPFGLPAGASTVPGVVTPVPQQPNPNAPPNRRPPQ